MGIYEVTFLGINYDCWDDVLIGVVTKMELIKMDAFGFVWFRTVIMILFVGFIIIILIIIFSKFFFSWKK